MKGGDPIISHRRGMTGTVKEWCYLIEVHITLNSLTVKGHAGYAKIGSDIYCSAVSALTQGLIHSLDWKKFISLFHGLSEQTKIREVMRIRSMEVPKFTGKNGKQIQEIQDLKSYYALPVKGGGGQAGLDALFSTLERMAVKDG